MSQNKTRVTPQAATRYCVDLLLRAGMSETDANTVARCLVHADLRGVHTHGITRMQIYMERLTEGFINPRPEMVVTKPTPVAAHVDGDNGLGFVTATRAMDEAIAMAGEFGLALAAVNHSNHYGMAASYIMQAAEAGFISFAFSNAPSAMPAWGGREPLLGTSPFAAGAPMGGDAAPFVLDFTPAITTRGALRRAVHLGKPIPEGLALDKDGRPTTDPKAAFEGVVLPMGGPKGSGLAMLMDVMAGVFSGAGYAGGVADLYGGPRPQDVGHMFMVIRPGLFMTTEDFLARMDVLKKAVHDLPCAEGFDEVLMPGERGARSEATYRAEGIPFTEEDIAFLNKTAAQFETAEIEVQG
ncbi:Ldh family oxidoreductase [Breoghania sp.]|uniref:Ldh family oxidoreductase n=1 Tax=Breoghania sp. TaxID=2065378 RepID=UPI002AA5E56C|nr:Ldh family oxidoreductase [Breoghania sp.]